jgi:anti-sigma B factor antagonist
MASFKLEVEQRDGGTVPILAVSGELDLYTSPELDERLLELTDASGPGLVVDLGGSSFVDSSACRALLRAARRLADHGGRLVVVNRDPDVARLFEIMGLESFLVVVSNREDADAELTTA